MFVGDSLAIRKTTKKKTQKKASPKKRKTAKSKARPKTKAKVKRKKPIRKKVVKKKPVSKKKVVKKKVVNKTVKKEPKKPVKKEVEKAIEKQNLAEERAIRKKIVTILSDACVRQMLIEIGGENALAIVRNFHGNNSDEELAKKLKIKISDVRATLNKLHNEGLVNYIREKDSETGWYSYNWSLNHERMEKWATDQTTKIDILGNGGEYYFCPACGEATITDFLTAAGGDFRCERCNRLLEFVDEKRTEQLFEKRRM